MFKNTRLMLIMVAAIAANMCVPTHTMFSGRFANLMRTAQQPVKNTFFPKRSAGSKSSEFEREFKELERDLYGNPLSGLNPFKNPFAVFAYSPFIYFLGVEFCDYVKECYRPDHEAHTRYEYGCDFYSGKFRQYPVEVPAYEKPRHTKTDIFASHTLQP